MHLRSFEVWFSSGISQFSVAFATDPRYISRTTPPGCPQLLHTRSRSNTDIIASSSFSQTKICVFSFRLLFLLPDRKSSTKICVVAYRICRVKEQTDDRSGKIFMSCLRRFMRCDGRVDPRIELAGHHRRVEILAKICVFSFLFLLLLPDRKASRMMCVVAYRIRPVKEQADDPGRFS